jgi:hypothetical protein
VLAAANSRALAYRATVDDPTRFKRSRAVEAYVELTTRRYASGEIEWTGHISKCGDAGNDGPRRVPFKPLYYRASYRHAKCASCLAPRQAVACGLNERLRGQCPGTIVQCLNLEHEIHHSASKLRILGFEPLKQSVIARTLPIKLRGFRIPH